MLSRLNAAGFSISKKNEAYQDLIDNPEFLNAYPHLKTRFLEISRERSKSEKPADLLGGSEIEDSKKKEPS